MLRYRTHFFPLKKPFTVQMTSSVLFIHINHSRKKCIKINLGLIEALYFIQK